jgi:hypothetical protein
VEELGAWSRPEGVQANPETALKLVGSHSRRATRPIMASTRGLLYTFARMMGDVTAVKKGTVGKRVGRRVVGKV